jgi:hypothetical protein
MMLKFAEPFVDSIYPQFVQQINDFDTLRDAFGLVKAFPKEIFYLNYTENKNLLIIK